jgi:hypothetical protein
MNENNNTSIAHKPPKGRLLLGGGIFIFGFLCPLFTPLVVNSNLPGGWKAAISGLLVVGLPEIFMIIAVAILGKSGYKYLKSRLYGFFKKYAAPPDEVSKTRYRIGLVMFIMPVVFGLVEPYAGHLIPGHDTHQRLFALVGDVLLVVSFFVLGGDFWDKLRSLFIHKSKALLPGSKDSH